MTCRCCRGPKGDTGPQGEPGAPAVLATYAADLDQDFTTDSTGFVDVLSFTVNAPAGATLRYQAYAAFEADTNGVTIATRIHDAIEGVIAGASETTDSGNATTAMVGQRTTIGGNRLVRLQMAITGGAPTFASILPASLPGQEGASLIVDVLSPSA